jgi:dTDP-4-amino-4,6-dideoxygalactose transaminase
MVRSKAGTTAMKIPITRPVFGPEERAAVVKPLETGWVVQGPFVAEFEQKFSAFSGAVHSVATSSCTTAMHIAVAALGLKAGDEVIVPAFTWVSTPNVVEYMGATPVFCDIDLATFNIDVRRAASLVTPKTVGIFPVHLFGLCADMDPILDLARKHGLWVIEDAACGFNAWYKGRHCGSFGDMGCFSFHPRKAITTGEGGMITTAKAELAAVSRSLRDHGASRSDHARHHASTAFLLAEYDRVGFNFRLTDIQAAVGSVQMDRAPWINGERARVAARYDEALKRFDWLAPPVTPREYRHGYQAYVCLFRPETPAMANVDRLHEWRNRVMSLLEERGVSTRQGTHAPILQGFYRTKYSIARDAFPNSAIADRLSLTLPLYPGMTEDEQAYVINELAIAFEATSS